MQPKQLKACSLEWRLILSGDVSKDSNQNNGGLDLSGMSQQLREHGWPSDDVLDQIPFGEKLKQLGNHDEYGKHARDVVSCMNKLLSGTPSEALCDRDDTSSQDALTSFLEVWRNVRKIFGDDPGIKNHWGGLLRIGALYHDIGKTIHKDRHPLEGYQLIAHVNRLESEKLRGTLGEDNFRLLSQAVRYHDLFGVVGTGEASLPVLLDILPFHSSSVEEQKQFLSMVWVINIADISGVIPLTARKAQTLADDWKSLKDHIDDSKGNRQRCAQRLIESEQDCGKAIKRVRRMLMEPLVRVVGCTAEFESHFTQQQHVQDALVTTMGTELHEFVADFALVCKFDYLLRFIVKLEQYAVSNNKEPHEVAAVLVALVSKLVRAYSSLTKRVDGTRRRIGIEVAGWTRNEEISQSLIKILFEEREKAVQWASEEATAWYLD